MVNFELPNISEDYVHRIGRTGRAGAQGEAISLVCTEELGYLRDIEKLVDLKITKETIEGFEPDPDESTTPPKRGQNRSRGRGSKSSNNTKKSSIPNPPTTPPTRESASPALSPSFSSASQSNQPALARTSTGALKARCSACAYHTSLHAF